MLATPPTRTRIATRMSDSVPGRIAAGALAPAVVHGVYRSVVNISMRDALLSIASPANGGLPNGVLVDLGRDFRTLGLRPGMAVIATEGRIRVPAAALEIDLGEAIHWSPRLAPPQDGPPLAAHRWRRRADVAWTIARARGTRGGLGALLWSDVRPPDDLGVVKRAGPILDRLRAALLAGDPRATVLAAWGLIGLGPGLTPSGDDVLVGIEAALHALDDPAAGFLGDAIHHVDDRTTVIAATLLRHAAAGEFAERIHVLVTALLGDEDAAVPAAIERAVTWGATSGTDCLLGVLLGLDIAGGTRRWPV
jgi:hypothetical protein